MKITLNDIAEKLGITASTVSRAINENTEHLVRETTRKKIMKLIKNQGYKPNIKARGLKKQQLTNFNLILPVGIRSIFYDEYYSRMIKGITNMLLNTKYSLNILSIARDYSTEEIFKVLLDNEIAGLILSPYCKYIEFPFDLIEKYDFPIVSIDNEVRAKNIYNIILDHKNAGYLGAKFLWEKGYRDIILISDVAHSVHSELRKKGFHEFFKDKNSDTYNINNVEFPFSHVSGLPALKKILEIGKFPISIFSLNDEIAVGIINQLRKNNLICPGDINLLGFDGLSIGQYTSSRLCSVAFPFETIGEEAARILVKVLAGKKVKKKTIIEASITEGESC